LSSIQLAENISVRLRDASNKKASLSRAKYFDFYHGRKKIVRYVFSSVKDKVLSKEEQILYALNLILSEAPVEFFVEPRREDIKKPKEKTRADRLEEELNRLAAFIDPETDKDAFGTLLFIAAMGEDDPDQALELIPEFEELVLKPLLEFTTLTGILEEDLKNQKYEDAEMKLTEASKLEQYSFKHSSTFVYEKLVFEYHNALTLESTSYEDLYSDILMHLHSSIATGMKQLKDYGTNMMYLKVNYHFISDGDSFFELLPTPLVMIDLNDLEGSADVMLKFLRPNQITEREVAGFYSSDNTPFFASLSFMEKFRQYVGKFEQIEIIGFTLQHIIEEFQWASGAQ